MALFDAAASADTVWIQSVSGKGTLRYDNVTIEGIDGDQLNFLSASGDETRRTLAEVSRMAFDDEPTLTGAEESYGSGNFAGAIEGYRRSIRASSHDWVRKRAALRLMAAGQKASDLGASVVGFIYLAKADPDAALHATPVIPPDAPKATLVAAISQVTDAERGSDIDRKQHRALLNFHMKLLTALHDTDGAAVVLKELDKVGGVPDDKGGTTPHATGAVNRGRAEQVRDGDRQPGPRNPNRAPPTTQISPAQRDAAIQDVRAKLLKLQETEPERRMDAAARTRASAAYQQAAKQLADAESYRQTLGDSGSREERSKATLAISDANTHLVDIIQASIASDAQVIAAHSRISELCAIGWTRVDGSARHIGRRSKHACRGGKLGV